MLVRARDTEHKPPPGVLQSRSLNCPSVPVPEPPHTVSMLCCVQVSVRKIELNNVQTLTDLVLIVLMTGVCQRGPTHQSLLPHSQDGRVGLQVDPGAALHRLQTLHRDVGRVAQPQADQVEHPAGVPLRTGSVSPPRNGLHDRVMRHFYRPPHGFTCNRYKPVCRKLLTFYDSCSRRTVLAELHSQVLVFCGFLV